MNILNRTSKLSLFGFMLTVLVNFVCSSESYATMLEAGDIAVVEIDGLTVIGPTHYPDDIAFGFAIINFTDFSTGDILVASYHENTLSDSPIDTDILDGPALSFWSLNLHEAFVEDLQGFIRLESLSGSLDILSIEIELVAYGTEYYGEFNVSPVPAPASIWLFGASLVGLFGLKNNKV
ncbi:MAG: hypothetical protein KZQ93_20175 [Candidatus Thiodiazotropha sp. (ex Monitilora ramsayi)]|nr:hypothetical protein [Candidatus Thiodiazotropha sp. (ex Monitilora ramsayi)]